MLIRTRVNKLQTIFERLILNIPFHGNDERATTLACMGLSNAGNAGMIDAGRLLRSVRYREISNISHTKSPNLIDPRLVLQLSLLNPMKPGVRSRMKKYI